ncbi:hypothetical protein BLNAU_6680 [Blattamonas nauphoetae]|uniref:Uncharacterized protein n=1 Tax=Blattamonas nauphoetae TaxID=2049346 RepID=A0ABQ9Y3V0_9EUKA|nr:hypothetical protein BLNAU_6680 [Blattamonas nauphoetae]
MLSIKPLTLASILLELTSLKSDPTAAVYSRSWMEIPFLLRDHENQPEQELKQLLNIMESILKLVCDAEIPVPNKRFLRADLEPITSPDESTSLSRSAQQVILLLNQTTDGFVMVVETKEFERMEELLSKAGLGDWRKEWKKKEKEEIRTREKSRTQHDQSRKVLQQQKKQHKQEENTKERRVTSFDEGPESHRTSSISSSRNLSTIKTLLVSSNRHTINKCLFLKMAKQMRPDLVKDTRLPLLYSDDVMSYPLHHHVKALENRNKHEQPPGKDNDVQNPLVDSGRVVVAFPDQQKDFSPFLSQNEHSTKADSLSNREGFANQQQQHINPQFPQQSSGAIVTQNSQFAVRSRHCTTTIITIKIAVPLQSVRSPNGLRGKNRAGHVEQSLLFVDIIHTVIGSLPTLLKPLVDAILIQKKSGQSMEEKLKDKKREKKKKVRKGAENECVARFWLNIQPIDEYDIFHNHLQFSLHHSIKSFLTTSSSHHLALFSHDAFSLLSITSLRIHCSYG